MNVTQIIKKVIVQPAMAGVVIVARLAKRAEIAADNAEASADSILHNLKDTQTSETTTTQKSGVTNVETSGLKPTDKAETKATDKSGVRGTDKAGIKATDKAETKATDKAGIKTTDKAETRATDKALTKPTDKAETKSTDKAETVETQKTALKNTSKGQLLDVDLVPFEVQETADAVTEDAAIELTYNGETYRISVQKLT